MTKHLIVLFTAFTFAQAAVGRAQDAPAPAPPAPAAPSAPAAPAPTTPARPAAPASPQAPGPRLPVVSLKVQVVLSNYQGEKKVSSMPYTLSVATNNPPSSLRMGAQMAVQPGSSGPINYQDVFTNIDCVATTLDEGRFMLNMTIAEKSVYADSTTVTSADLKGMPVFRSFSSNERLILRDGQTSEFTTATDKVSGETTKVAVTLTVLK